MIDRKHVNSVLQTLPSIAFLQYLYHEEFNSSNTEILDQFPKDIYKRIIITLCILLLSIYKEQILYKDEKNAIVLNIPENIFDVLIQDLYTEEEGKLKVGNLTFDEKKEIIELIRNKLLHGDYVVDKNLVLNNQGIIGEVPLTELVNFCLLLTKAKSYKLHGPNIRPMVFAKKPTLIDPTPFETLKDLKKLCADFYFFKFIDEPEPGHKRTKQYMNVMDSFYESLHTSKDIINHHTFKNSVDMIMSKYQRKFKEHHINLRYELTPVSKSEKYQNIKEIFGSLEDYLKTMSPSQRRQYMLLTAINVLEYEGNEEMLLTKAILNAASFLKGYITGKPMKTEEYGMTQSITFIDDMTIAAGLNTFFCVYHYGLDEILSKGPRTSLRSILEGEYFDFSILDIDCLYDPEMTIELSFADFPSQAEHIKNKIPEQEEKYENAHNAYSKYLREAKEIKSDVKDRLRKNIHDSKFELDHKKNLSADAEIYIDKLYAKYVKNINIIAHIRNALAHGNIKLLPYRSGDALQDRELLIEDIYEGKVTYSKKVKYKEFVRLIEVENLTFVLGFLMGKARISHEELELKKK